MLNDVMQYHYDEAYLRGFWDEYKGLIADLGESGS